MNGKGVVEAFREKTNQCFHKIGDCTPAEIETIAKEHIENVIQEEEIDVEIIDVIITGSRCRGIEKEFSDLDMVVEFKSEHWREDSLFCLLHEEENKLAIEGIPIDFNPISKEKTGTLEEYLPRAEKYLEEEERRRDMELLKRAQVLDAQFGCFPMVSGTLVSLPAEYDEYLSEHEQRRLVEVFQKQLQRKAPSLEEQIQRANGRVQKVKSGPQYKSERDM